MEWKIPYGKQNIEQDDIDAVVAALTSEFLTQGPANEKFEKEFAEYLGVDYALSCSNGTAALHLCMLALGIKPGQKVLTTPITFVASSNCVLYQGGLVDFVDVSLNNYLLDLDLLEKKLQQEPDMYAGIVVVDFAGYPIDQERLRSIADKYGVWIVEDACHAPGATFKDKSGNVQFAGNGSFVDLTVFSFHPVKHIACGEGGMITTSNRGLYDKLQLYRTHGITKDSAKYIKKTDSTWYHEMQVLGFNYRLSDIQAALGSSQLRKLPESLQERRRIAQVYNQELSDTPLVLPKVSDEVEHAYHLYVVRSEHRDELYEYLREHGIYSQIHYIPVYFHPYYEGLGFEKGLCPNAELYYSQCLSLPMYPSISDSELDYVIDTIKNFFKEK